MVPGEKALRVLFLEFRNSDHYDLNLDAVFQDVQKSITQRLWAKAKLSL